MMVPQAHDSLPFHAAPHSAAPSQGMAPQGMAPQGMAPQGKPSQPKMQAVIPPQGMAPQGMAPQGKPSQPKMQAVVQPVAAPVAPPPSPPSPPPRPSTLPTDSWKLQPSPLLYPFAPPSALPQPPQPQPPQAWGSAHAAPMQAAVAPTYAQPHAPYAQGSDPGPVVPASLGLQVPRLTLEQYACMAAELAVAPASAVQVRMRYGLDDSSHLAEQGAWQRRFSLDAQLFASYSSLFQHYRDWLNQQRR
jgi:hypothetical protein